MIRSACRPSLRKLPTLAVATLLSICAAARGQDRPAWVPDVVKPAVSDRQHLVHPDQVHLLGLLGHRIELNESKRLMEVNEEELLAGFRHRPGKQAWIGEHVGKFLHAASLAYAYTGDPQLREKIDRVATELIKTQEPDGYLGTYTPDKRFQLAPDADWDVWVHKYDLMGLLTHYQVTGSKPSLEAAVKVGNLLCNTFGPGKKSLLSAGTHVGMAATSVLEPMVYLYRVTGDARYLDFCKYIPTQWEEPSGPHILSSLTQGKRVDKTANGKGYEMLSNLVGLGELYRVTGDPAYLAPLENAWEDITSKRLHITGSGTQGELFRGDYELPNANANSSETCVTVTWMQLNLQLLRITDDPRYAQEIEKSVYNHLIASQKPTGNMWCYYTELEGKKGYHNSTDCCLSSGPRGLALTPTVAYATDAEGLIVNLIEAGFVNLKLEDGTSLKVEQETVFPTEGKASLTLHPEKPATFVVKFRIPAWVQGKVQVQINGQDANVEAAPGTYATVRREWKEADRLTVSFAVPFLAIAGQHGNSGKVAFQYGPQVLAVDGGLDPDSLKQDQKKTVAQFVVPSSDAKDLFVSAQLVPGPRRTWKGDQSFTINVVRSNGEKGKLQLVPFADAGADGSLYMVWLPLQQGAR